MSEIQFSATLKVGIEPMTLGFLTLRFLVAHKRLNCDAGSRVKHVAQRGARTHDPGIKSPMLYRLS